MFSSLSNCYYWINLGKYWTGEGLNAVLIKIRLAIFYQGSLWSHDINQNKERTEPPQKASFLLNYKWVPNYLLPWCKDVDTQVAIKLSKMIQQFVRFIDFNSIIFCSNIDSSLSNEHEWVEFVRLSANGNSRVLIPIRIIKKGLSRDLFQRLPNVSVLFHNILRC